MFYVETKDTSGNLNNIQMVRLKDKLGTRQLPTAELLLHGTKAHLVGELGRGVATISDMLTVSRTYNTLFSSSIIRRWVMLLFGNIFISHGLVLSSVCHLKFSVEW